MSDHQLKYFFVGVGKCGTSWIYEFMRRRNVIATPSLKEPHLIDVDDAQRNALIAKLYAPKAGQPLADFSNTYYWDPDNADKISDVVPDAKIIITTRLPSDRILSHFGFLQRSGMVPEHVTLAQHLDEGDAWHIVARSDYDTVIDRYVARFGQQNVLVLPLEMLKEDPQRYADTLLDFLDQPRLTLTPEDHAPVLKAAKVRSRVLARSAKSVADGLRKLGLLRMLGTLKRLKLIRAVLFKDAGTALAQDFGTATDRVHALDRTYDRILRTSGMTAHATPPSPSPDAM